MNRPRSVNEASAKPVAAKPKRWKVMRRFDIYEDTQKPGVGGTYIGTTRGNGPLPDGVEKACEANAKLMAESPELLALLIEVIDDGLKTNMEDWQERANAAVVRAGG